jgi:hypothetical protein
MVRCSDEGRATAVRLAERTVETKSWSNRGVALSIAILLALVAGCSSSSLQCGTGTVQSGNECVVADGPAANGAAGPGDATATWTGKWQCSFTLDQIGFGTAVYPPIAVTTQVNGSSLSVAADVDPNATEEQKFLCGFNYTIEALTASLAPGAMTCPYGGVPISNATISLSASGTQLTIDETGTEPGSTTMDKLHGDCSRSGP